MTSKTRLVYLLITTFCLAGCGYKSRNPVSKNGLPSADTIQTALAPRYAKGFKITVRPDGVKLLSISEPNNNHAIPELFALVPKGTKAEIPDGYTVIPTPTDRVICMTTPQLAGFTGLNAYDKVVATSTTRRMQNKEWLARLKDGRVKKIGMEGNFDTGLLDNIDNIRAKVGAVTGYYLLNENASLIMDCIEVMRVSGTKFIFDPGPLVGSIDKEILKRMVKASAVITPNEAELAVFEQEDKNFIENFIKNKGIVVRKQGNRGGMCYTRHGIFNYNSVKTEAVDTTGAGDSFTGALCYSLGSGTDIKSSVELASVCAAKTVEINEPHGFWKIKED